jgi:regulator of protease activity HflC (stomatin/prohibitin superfamily)
MVKWSRCQEATLHGPGLIWFWPLVTEKVDVNIQWKSMVTHVQTITLTDGTTVSARTLTRWKPDDVLKVVVSEEDYSDTVAETAQSVLVDVLGSCDATFLKQSSALSVALTLAMQAELREIGVSVQKCKFTELCMSPAFRIINDA